MKTQLIQYYSMIGTLSCDASDRYIKVSSTPEQFEEAAYIRAYLDTKAMKAVPSVALSERFASICTKYKTLGIHIDRFPSDVESAMMGDNDKTSAFKTKINAMTFFPVTLLSLSTDPMGMRLHDNANEIMAQARQDNLLFVFTYDRLTSRIALYVSRDNATQEVIKVVSVPYYAAAWALGRDIDKLNARLFNIVKGFLFNSNKGLLTVLEKKMSTKNTDKNKLVVAESYPEKQLSQRDLEILKSYGYAK